MVPTHGACKALHFDFYALLVLFLFYLFILDLHGCKIDHFITSRYSRCEMRIVRLCSNKNSFTHLFLK